MGAGGIIQILLADRVHGGQRLDAVQVGLGRLETRRLLSTQTLGLINGGLESARVDLEQWLALFHQVAFAIVLLDQVTGDLRPDEGIDVAVERADPFHVDRHVALGDGDDFDHWRWWCRSLLLLASAGQQKRYTGQPGRGVAASAMGG
jgi:hypothetical protein